MENIPSLYTETLGKLLVNNHYGEENETPSLTSVLVILRKFPSFVVEDDDVLDFETLFMEKYDIREIGAETEELFIHFWKERANELLIKYKYKIDIWAENFDKLFDFKITLNITKNKTIEKDGTNVLAQTGSEGNTRTLNTETNNTYYLNPITRQTANLKVQDADKVADTGTIGDSKTVNLTDTNTVDLTDTHRENNVLEVPQAVWGKTRPYIMQQIMELHDIYIECLNDFEDLFMGVY